MYLSYANTNVTCAISSVQVQFRQMKVVSAAGSEPARAVCPGVIRKDAGDLVFVGGESVRPWTATRGESLGESNQ